MRLALLLLVACHSRPLTVTLPPGPLPIAIVAPIPGAQKPSCWLDPAPHPPDNPEVSRDVSQEMVDRFYIHFRDYTKLIEWAHDVEIQNNQLRDCLQKLVEP